LNGTLNAGKPTVARLLAKRLPRPAVVEIDQAVPLNLKNAAGVIRNFAEAGYSAIVPYPLSATDHAYLCDQLKDLGPILAVTLRRSRQKCQADTRQRKISAWEYHRIDHHFDIGLCDPAFGDIIDNSQLTAEQTAEAVLAQLPAWAPEDPESKKAAPHGTAFLL
jgi:hypothetical protein